MPGWVNHKLGSRLFREISVTPDITLMAKSEEELKSFLMKVKEKSKKLACLQLNIQKMKIMASGPITLQQLEGGKVETVTDFLFLGFKITVDSDGNHEIKRKLLLALFPLLFAMK